MIISALLTDFAVNFVAGVAGLLLVLWIERQRRPKLHMKVGTPNRIDETDEFRRPPAKWLYVQICNAAMPKWLAWVYNREPATTCQAWISFHRMTGEHVFGKEMLARWSETPEPALATIEVPVGEEKAAPATAAPSSMLTPSSQSEEKRVYVRLQEVQLTVDIPAGECSSIDVVMRFKGEDECYGWNNESYLYRWRHPSWLLGHSAYIASVRVKTGGRQFQDAFQIVNDVPYDSFRLEPLDPETRRRLKAQLFAAHR